MSLGYEKAAEVAQHSEVAYSLSDVVQVMGQVRHAMESVIEGKRSSVDLALVVLLAEGHLLVEDVPGVGKTMLAKALGRSIACSVRRVQFTPDLLPSDITGVSVFNQETRDFEFKPGGIFANIVVGDEINRASPKTQSALLESMEERQVSVDGTTYLLGAAVHGRRDPEPDRDGGHLSAARGPAGPVHGPDPDGLSDAQLRAGHAGLAWLLRSARGAAARDRRRDHPRTDRGGQEGLRQCRPSSTTSSRWSTPRETPAICGSAPHRARRCNCLRASRAFAALTGRDYVTPDDVAALGVSVLAHRVLPSTDAQLARRTVNDVIAQAISSVHIPDRR